MGGRDVHHTQPIRDKEKLGKGKAFFNIDTTP
jgi:hypothetical protein